jgi:hypothetical protein
MMKPSLLLAVLLGASLVALGPPARAQAATVSAFLGGLRSDKLGEPEVVVMNTTGQSLSLTIILRDGAGVQLGDPAALTVAAQATGTFDVQAAVKTLGLNGKPYLGLISAEVRGEAPFDQSTTVVHAVQYFGPRKKPKAGYVVRPLFTTSGP